MPRSARFGRELESDPRLSFGGRNPGKIRVMPHCVLARTPIHGEYRERGDKVD